MMGQPPESNEHNPQEAHEQAEGGGGSNKKVKYLVYGIILLVLIGVNIWLWPRKWADYQRYNQGGGSEMMQMNEQEGGEQDGAPAGMGGPGGGGPGAGGPGDGQDAPEPTQDEAPAEEEAEDAPEEASNAQ